MPPEPTGFLRHRELCEAITGLADDCPQLVEVDEIGRSRQGRELLLLAVTDGSTGPAADKPAVWVDANIHSVEVAGSVAALHLAHHLVEGWRAGDERVRHVLATRAFYILPRVNPDGAELALADAPRFVRASVRKWPAVGAEAGLVPQDVDGDGRVLTMRVADPHGPWRVADEDSRLLVARAPGDSGPGPYYRLLPEGIVHDPDDDLVVLAPKTEALDLNRSFPVEWEVGRTSGPYPLSEPEVRAVVEAIDERPNIGAALFFHTFSGVHLRPSATGPDDTLPTFDRRVYEAVGRALTAMTGYPAISIHHDFSFPGDSMTGIAQEWAYHHRGIHSWTTELWNPQAAAGIVVDDFVGWYDAHGVDDDLRLLAWNDADLDGRGYVDWYPFDHPQLGPVEIGGWDPMHCWFNPPLPQLADEVRPHADTAVHLALISPLLAFHRVTAEAIGVRGDDTVWRVRAVVANVGWLPTQATDRAVEIDAVPPVRVAIALPDDVELLVGRPEADLGQLTGRALKTDTVALPADPTTDRARAEWVVRGRPGRARITARHPRAGCITVEVELQAQ